MQKKKRPEELRRKKKNRSDRRRRGQYRRYPVDGPAEPLEPVEGAAADGPADVHPRRPTLLSGALITTRERHPELVGMHERTFNSFQFVLETSLFAIFQS